MPIIAEAAQYELDAQSLKIRDWLGSAEGEQGLAAWKAEEAA